MSHLVSTPVESQLVREGLRTVGTWHASPPQRSSLVVATPGMRVCARVLSFPAHPDFFFAAHPPAHGPPCPGVGTFSNRWWPTAERGFFPLLLATLLPSSRFFFRRCAPPLSLVPLSRRCPIHPPQAGVATCSTLFHLIRGHKLLPRPLRTRKKTRSEREIPGGWKSTRDRTTTEARGMLRVSFARVPQIAPRRFFTPNPPLLSFTVPFRSDLSFSLFPIAFPHPLATPYSLVARRFFRAGTLHRVKS